MNASLLTMSNRVCMCVCVCARVHAYVHAHSSHLCFTQAFSYMYLRTEKQIWEMQSKIQHIAYPTSHNSSSMCNSSPPPPAPVFTWRTCTQSTTRLKLARSTRRCGFHHRKQVAFRQDPTDDQPPNPPELANCQNDCNSDVRHWLWMTTHSRLHKTTTRC